MLSVVASIAALLLSTVILMTGNGLLGTLLSVRMTLETFPAGITGLVMAAYFAGLMAGAMGASAVVRRAGHIRAFAVFAAVVTAATLLHALFVSAWSWGLLRAVTGFCMAGLYTIIESWLNERGTGPVRGRLFSIYQMTSFLGLGGGQFLLALRPVEGADLFLINAVLLALCLVPVSLTRAQRPTPPARPRMALRAVVTGSPLGVAVCAASGVVNGATFALAPVFVVAQVGVGSVATFMGAIVLGGMLLQYPIGHLSDVFDRRRLIIALSLALLAVSGALLWLADRGSGMLIGIGAIYGGLTYTLYPLAVAHINDRVTGAGADFVGVASAVLFTWGLGAVIGPVAVGQLMGVVGADGLFQAVSVIAAGIAIVALLARREEVPNEEQSRFVGMARTTTMIAEMDPRTEEPEDPQLDWIERLEQETATEVADAEPDPVMQVQE